MQYSSSVYGLVKSIYNKIDKMSKDMISIKETINRQSIEVKDVMHALQMDDYYRYKSMVRYDIWYLSMFVYNN